MKQSVGLCTNSEARFTVRHQLFLSIDHLLNVLRRLTEHPSTAGISYKDLNTDVCRRQWHETAWRDVGVQGHPPRRDGKLRFQVTSWTKPRGIFSEKKINPNYVLGKLKQGTMKYWWHLMHSLHMADPQCWNVKWCWFQQQNIKQSLKFPQDSTRCDGS